MVHRPVYLLFGDAKWRAYHPCLSPAPLVFMQEMGDGGVLRGVAAVIVGLGNSAGLASGEMKCSPVTRIAKDFPLFLPSYLAVNILTVSPCWPPHPFTPAGEMRLHQTISLPIMLTMNAAVSECTGQPGGWGHGPRTEALIGNLMPLSFPRVLDIATVLLPRQTPLSLPP